MGRVTDNDIIDGNSIEYLLTDYDHHHHFLLENANDILRIDRTQKHLQHDHEDGSCGNLYIPFMGIPYQLI